MLNDLTRAWLVNSWTLAHPAQALTMRKSSGEPRTRFLGSTDEYLRRSMRSFTEWLITPTSTRDPTSLPGWRRTARAVGMWPLRCKRRQRRPRGCWWHFGRWIRSCIQLGGAQMKDLPIYACRQVAPGSLDLAPSAVLVDDHPRTWPPPPPPARRRRRSVCHARGNEGGHNVAEIACADAADQRRRCMMKALRLHLSRRSPAPAWNTSFSPRRLDAPRRFRRCSRLKPILMPWSPGRRDRS